MKMALPSLQRLFTLIYFQLGYCVHGHEIFSDNKGITVLVRLMV